MRVLHESLVTFMSSYRRRLTTLIIGYAMGGWAAYYFWTLTLLIPSEDKTNFIVKVWNFYIAADNQGEFFGFLFLFIVGWVIALIAIICEYVYIYNEWEDYYLWFNIFKTVTYLGLLFGVFYFFLKSILILIAVLIIGFFILYLVNSSKSTLCILS